MKSRFLGSIAIIGVALFAANQAAAVTVAWATLTSDDGSNVYGSLATPTGSVSITYSGGYLFDQLNDTGYNYWEGDGLTYTGPANEPSVSDQIALNDANTGVITFSSPVKGVYLALNSWNDAEVTFSQAFSIVGQGCGVFGCGTFQPNGDNTGFTGLGETAGVLYFPGVISTLTFTDTVDEYYHSLTVGDYLSGPIPEPAGWLLMLTGFGMVGAALRKSSQKGLASR